MVPVRTAIEAGWEVVFALISYVTAESGMAKEELIEFKGASGRDLSALAKPPNLGLLMLRFPVDNLSALARHLESHGVPPLSGIRQVQLPPTGPARQVSVRAPDGAWLEFYEEIR